MHDKLRITEIFHSIQGESLTVGCPTTFIRLTGCPLRCQYCDTTYAFKGGQWQSIDEIVTKAHEFGASYVTVTGGEPLAQPECVQLMQALVSAGFKVSLETSGALSIESVPKDVMIVMDLKTPSSLESSKNLFENLEHLKPSDQIKFVICNQADFEWTKDIIRQYQLNERCELLVSPSHQQLHPRELAEWVLDSGLPVRLQVQLHKILWGEEPGR